MSLLARTPSRLASAADQITAAGGTAHSYSVDVTDRPALEAVIAEATAVAGPVDVLVTSAGIARPGYVAELEESDYRDQMEVNYFGTVWAARAVLPSMTERRTGSIVIVSSAAGLVGVFGYSAYGPTKFAVRGFAETLRAEIVSSGVYVGCVFPPDVDTPQLAFENRFKPPETRAVSGTVEPLRPEQVAAAIVAGIERNRFWITPDRSTRVLSRSVGLLWGPLNALFDRRAAQAARGQDRDASSRPR